MYDNNPEADVFDLHSTMVRFITYHPNKFCRQDNDLHSTMVRFIISLFTDYL